MTQERLDQGETEQAATLVALEPGDALDEAVAKALGARWRRHSGGAGSRMRLPDGGVVALRLYVADAIPRLYTYVGPRYSRSADEAVALAERFRLLLSPLDEGGYNATDGLIRDAYGQNIPHAVALWVASYVRAGSPS